MASSETCERLRFRWCLIRSRLSVRKSVGRRGVCVKKNLPRLLRSKIRMVFGESGADEEYDMKDIDPAW
jgi:hypothetical protein